MTSLEGHSKSSTLNSSRLALVGEDHTYSPRRWLTDMGPQHWKLVVPYGRSNRGVRYTYSPAKVGMAQHPPLSDASESGPCMECVEKVRLSPYAFQHGSG